jgi:heme oxygenase
MWRLDRHAAWIAEDLRSLGHSPAPSAQRAGQDQNGADAAARALAPLSPKSVSRLLGSLYVLAGSTLGARMLHKLTVTRALPTPAGSAYLANAGGSMNWQQFLTFLEGAAIDSEDRMIEGALATFAGVQRSLEFGA